MTMATVKSSYIASLSGLASPLIAFQDRRRGRSFQEQAGEFEYYITHGRQSTAGSPDGQ